MNLFSNSMSCCNLNLAQKCNSRKISQISHQAAFSTWRPRLDIKLLESPIPTAAAAAPTASSQKAHFDDISGTKRGTIDPLVSKRPEKNSEKENSKFKKKNAKNLLKMVKNGQKWSKMVKMVKMV